MQQVVSSAPAITRLHYSTCLSTGVLWTARERQMTAFSVSAPYLRPPPRKLLSAVVGVGLASHPCGPCGIHMCQVFNIHQNCCMLDKISPLCRFTRSAGAKLSRCSHTFLCSALCIVMAALMSRFSSSRVSIKSVFQTRLRSVTCNTHSTGAVVTTVKP